MSIFKKNLKIMVLTSISAYSLEQNLGIWFANKYEIEYGFPDIFKMFFKISVAHKKETNSTLVLFVTI